MMTTDTVVDTNDKPLTMETLMATVDAILERSSAKIERDLAVSSARFQRDLAQSNAEASARFKRDLDEASAKSDAEWKKWREEWDKGMQELKNSQAETDKIVKQNAKQLGGMGNSNGDFAQEFFFNALYDTKTVFGQVFDEVKTEKRKIKKTGVEVQYDIMLINGKSICIVEVKYKADTNDVARLIKIEKNFRGNFPEHADKKLYLALASMSFDTYVEKACRDEGIAMIKQKGETIEIFDENLKTF